MNRDHMQLWVEALESDEYRDRQCKKVLTEYRAGQKRYCALGLGLQTMRGQVFLVHSDCNEPYQALAQWLEVDTPDRILVEVDGKSRPVWALNDDGMSFAEIAQYLRKQYL